MDKLSLHTADKTDKNIAAIAALFPNTLTEVVRDGKTTHAIDFDMLKQELSSVLVEGAEERYAFNWPDKRQSVLLANMPNFKTLRPCREESVNFDTTENLYIEGDNIEVLKLLQETYLGKVKMIYIDPPYNTGKDAFVYDDDFSENIAEYNEDSGDFDEDGYRLYQNLSSNGRFHTDWLNMIYPRLKIAKDLLADDGVIFINMDEHEICNLQKICNEIFGAWNELGVIIWDKRNPKGDARGISYQHEYICVFAKNIDVFLEKNEMKRPKKNATAILKKAQQLFSKISLTYTLEQANVDFSAWINTQNDFSGGEKAYSKIDDNGEVYRPVSMAWPNKKKAPDDYFVPLIHPITQKPCPLPERGWRNPSATMQNLLSKGLILFGRDETTQPNRKYLLKENMYENITSLMYYGGSDVDLLNEMEIPFETPKVVDVCMEHIRAFVKDGDIILDFFSGSATTAHACMQLNAEDGGNRKFIMVQIPEECKPDSEAAKAEYRTICDIGKERIRRAGKKINEAIDEGNSQIKLGGEPKKPVDIGFRVLKIDSTNMKDVYYEPEEFTQGTLAGLIDNIKDDRTPEDLLFQVMLDLGVLLSCKIEKEVIGGKNVFTVYNGGECYLIACFDFAPKSVEIGSDSSGYSLIDYR